MTKDNIISNLINKLSIGVGLINQEGKIIFSNETIKKITGYSEEDIKTMDDWYKKAYPNKKYRKKIKELFQYDMQNNISDRTYKITTADGSFKFLNFHYSKLADGKMLFEIIDITQRIEQKQELENQKIIFENLFTNSLEGIVLLDSDLNVLTVNKKFEEIFEVTKNNIVNKYIFDVVSLNEDFEDINKEKEKLMRYENWENEVNFNVNGELKYCTVHIFSVSNNSHEKLIYAVVDDITENREKEIELRGTKERLELAVEGANIGVWDWNARDNSVHYNKNWAQMLGYQASELENNLNTWLEILHPEDKKQALKDINNHFNGDTKIYFNEHRLKTKSGKWKWIRDIGKVIDRDKEGNPLRVVGVHIDIDKQKRSAKKIEYLSMHDELTGLYNRRYFNNEMDRLHNSRKYPLSIIVGDLNGLKIINDTYGHSLGDRYIKTIARILKETLRSEDVIARIGGDEFAIILPETNNDKVKDIAERILNNVEAENNIDELPERLGIALGYETIYSSDEDIEKCYSRADKKMYKQKFKDRSKNNSVIN